MKKILLVMVALLCVTTVSAQSKLEEAANYVASQKWSVGLRVGSGLQADAECFYSDKAYVEALRKRGKISDKAAANRTLLLEIMDAVGLRPYVKEWWHFQERISMSATRERYKLLDF